MLGHAGLAELELRDEFADGALAAAQQVEDLAAVWLGERGVGGHRAHITNWLYVRSWRVNHSAGHPIDPRLAVAAVNRGATRDAVALEERQITEAEWCAAAARDGRRER